MAVSSLEETLSTQKGGRVKQAFCISSLQLQSHEKQIFGKHLGLKEEVFFFPSHLEVQRRAAILPENYISL